MKIFSVLLILVLLNSSCQNSTQRRVINIDDQVGYATIKDMGLDAEYRNLLIPSFSTDEEYAEVLESWTNFHKEIGGYLKADNFQWNVPDSSIEVNNKIYFDRQGNVQYFLFKVHNENVSASKKAAYRELLEKNVNELRVDLRREMQFAQCGKVKYINN